MRRSDQRPPRNRPARFVVAREPEVQNTLQQLVASSSSSPADMRARQIELDAFIAALDVVEAAGGRLQDLPSGRVREVTAILRRGIRGEGGEDLLGPVPTLVHQRDRRLLRTEQAQMLPVQPSIAVAVPEAERRPRALSVDELQRLHSFVEQRHGSIRGSGTRENQANSRGDAVTTGESATAEDAETGDAEELDVCAICLSEMRSGELLVALACTHTYHRGCVGRWLLSSPLCPLCKTHALGNASDEASAGSSGGTPRTSGEGRHAFDHGTSDEPDEETAYLLRAAADAIHASQSATASSSSNAVTSTNTHTATATPCTAVNPTASSSTAYASNSAVSDRAYAVEAAGLQHSEAAAPVGASGRGAGGGRSGSGSGLAAALALRRPAPPPAAMRSHHVPRDVGAAACSSSHHPLVVSPMRLRATSIHIGLADSNVSGTSIREATSVLPVELAARQTVGRGPFRPLGPALALASEGGDRAILPSRQLPGLRATARRGSGVPVESPVTSRPVGLAARGASTTQAARAPPSPTHAHSLQQ